MKETIIILVIFFVSTLIISTIEANNPVLDYVTGKPIRMLDGCIINSTFDDTPISISGEDTGWVFLFQESPGRPAQFFYPNPDEEDQDHDQEEQDDELTVSTTYRIRFNNSELFWTYTTANLSRLVAGGDHPSGGIDQGNNDPSSVFGFKEFRIEETTESRVYQLYLEFSPGVKMQLGLKTPNGLQFYLDTTGPIPYDPPPSPLGFLQPERAYPLNFTFRAATQ